MSECVSTASTSEKYTAKWPISHKSRITHQPRILARGFTPCFLAAASVMRTRAAAPSLRVLALAVIVPPGTESGLKADLRPANFVKSALFVCM